MIRSWLFRALNRCNRDYPRYEKVAEVASTVTAIVVFYGVTAVALVRFAMRRGRP